MDIVILNVAVVVVANQHNPALLHPAFLEAQGIVPAGWELQDAPLCTSPLSVVKYRNGVTLTVEPRKLQILQNEPADPCASRVEEIAEKYVRTLPHVRYTAVGINFSAAVDWKNPAEMMLRRFIRSGALALGEVRPRASLVRLAYPLGDGAVLNLGVSPGKLKRNKQSRETDVLLLNANYHHPLPEATEVGGVGGAIGRFRERCQHFQQVVIPAFAAGDSEDA